MPANTPISMTPNPSGAGVTKGHPKAFNQNYAGFRSRRSAQELLRDEDGDLNLSKEYLKQLCKEMKQYTTPYLNDQLYLHFKGTLEQKCPHDTSTLVRASLGLLLFVAQLTLRGQPITRMCFQSLGAFWRAQTPLGVWYPLWMCVRALSAWCLAFSEHSGHKVFFSR